MIWGVGDNAISWDPASETITSLARSGFDLFCTGHAFLSDGTLFVAGGNIQLNVGLPTAGVYDPAGNVWRYFPDMNAGRRYATATVLSNGDVLVVSGQIDMTVGDNPLPQVFQVASGTWRSLTGAQLLMDLYPTMFLAPNGQVFNSGPSTTTRYLNTAGTGAW